MPRDRLIIPKARSVEDWTRTAQLCSGWAREFALKRAVTAHEDFIDQLLRSATEVACDYHFDSHTGTWRQV